MISHNYYVKTVVNCKSFHFTDFPYCLLTVIIQEVNFFKTVHGFCYFFRQCTLLSGSYNHQIYIYYCSHFEYSFVIPTTTSLYLSSFDSRHRHKLILLIRFFMFFRLGQTEHSRSTLDATGFDTPSHYKNLITGFNSSRQSPCKIKIFLGCFY